MDREQKYRRLEQASPEEIAALQKQVKESEWRQTYHIQPVTGLLNDPNGFAYFAGEYHLFISGFLLERTMGSSTGTIRPQKTLSIGAMLGKRSRLIRLLTPMAFTQEVASSKTHNCI